MDIPPFLWFFWAIAAVVIFFGMRKKWRRRRAWRDAADQLGLSFNGAIRRDTYELTGDVDGVDVYVHIEASDEGLGTKDCFFTVFETTHDQQALIEERVQHIMREREALVDKVRELVAKTRKESARSAS